MNRKAWLLGVVAGLALVAGCKHCCRRGCPPDTCVARPPLAVGPAHPLTPLGTTPTAPVYVDRPPAAPRGARIPPPPPDNRYYNTPVPPDNRSINPPAPPPPDSKVWQAAPDAGAVVYPDGGAAPGPGSVRLLPPTRPESPPASAAAPAAAAPVVPPAPDPVKPATPSAPEPPAPSPPPGSAIASLPVGIASFNVAGDRLASGLRPTVEGLDWLQANGYRSVIHLRPPGQDDAADRREIEKRGLKYFSIEVSPQILNRVIVEDFNRLVADKANLPLFVYDKDGMLAGALWYLHFRTAGNESDDVARMRAARLGLKQDGEHREMWLAIQRYLGDSAVR